MSTLSLSSPTMSDKTLLLNVEDLIAIAMGPHEGNTVNFKYIQTVLHILARQMRMLETKVVLVAGELPEQETQGRSRFRSRASRAQPYRRPPPPVFKNSEERIEWEKKQDELERLSRRRRSGSARGRGRSGGREYDDEHGGRGKSGGRYDRDDDERGGRGKSGGRYDRDDDERGGRGKSGGRYDRDDDERGGRGKSGGRYDRDDDERGGRDKSGGRYDRDDDERGGRDKSGGRYDRDDDERGGRGKSGGRYDRDDDERGGRGKSGGRYDRDDDERGGRGKSGGRYDRDDDERGGRGKSGGRYDRDDDERGGRDKSGGRYDRDDDERGGRGKSGGRYDRDDDERGGRGKSGGRYDRDDDERGGRGRARDGQYDRDDDERGGRGRLGGERDDEEHGGRRDRSRDGRDRSAGGRGRDAYDDENEISDRSGSDLDVDGRQRRGRSGGRGGRDGDDEETEGRGRTGGRGAGGRDGFDEKGGRRGRPGAGFEGEDDGDVDGGRGGWGRDGAQSGGVPSGGGRGGRDEGKGGYGPGPGAKGAKDEAVGGKQGIGVREIEGPGKEKLLVVEKGPTTKGRARDGDSIAVVTQSQFALLEEQVEELWRAAGPLPPLTMPDNQQLRKELAAGASLTDAMQAMQVSARVQAAEQAIMKLGGLLTQLATSGALPPDAAGAVMAGGWADGDEALSKSAKTPGSGTDYTFSQMDPLSKTSPGQASRTPGATRATSKESFHPGGKYVTKPEMGSALKKLRDELSKGLQAQVDKATVAADNAEKTAQHIGDKVEELLKMDNRLTALQTIVDDYTEQLNGFDASLNTQVDSFKEQMTTMRAELRAGLQQLELSNSNPETAAVMELKERFEVMVHGLDDTLLQHTALSNMQHQLTQELQTLIEGVEMLREEKADRDELLDILRDKADISMMEGLVRQEEFDQAQADFEERLEKCNGRFKKQDEVWMDAIKDLRNVADTKAQMTDLFKLRDEVTSELQSIDDKIDRLALILGQPEAAMLMFKLSRNGVCASCLTPALMRPGGEPQPPALPAARGPGVPAPCAPAPRAPDYPDLRTHRCHRWVGGSHTLLPPLARAHATPIAVTERTNKFTDYGEDGRLYYMESPLEPCAECHQQPPTPAPSPPAASPPSYHDLVDAGGDGDTLRECPC